MGREYNETHSLTTKNGSSKDMTLRKVPGTKLLHGDWGRNLHWRNGDAKLPPGTKIKRVLNVSRIFQTGLSLPIWKPERDLSLQECKRQIPYRGGRATKALSLLNDIAQTWENVWTMQGKMGKHYSASHLSPTVRLCTGHVLWEPRSRLSAPRAPDECW